MSKLAFYFGYGSGGHFLRGLPGPHSSTLNPQRDCPGFPWTIRHLDTVLLENRKIADDPDGRVFWTCGRDTVASTLAWYAFYWWDRSGDSRGASNSGFYVRGFPIPYARPLLARARIDAWEFACSKWPEVIARQHFPLVVQP